MKVITFHINNLKELEPTLIQKTAFGEDVTSIIKMQIKPRKRDGRIIFFCLVVYK